MLAHKSVIWDRVIGYFLLAVVFVFFSHGFTSYIGDIFGTDGIAITWLILHAVILTLFLLKNKRLKLLYFKNHVWLLIFVCFVSVAWATDPALTLRRCILLTSTTFLGIFLADSYELNEVLRLMIFFVAFLLIVSLALWMIDAPLVEMNDGHNKGSFKGVFNHKNYFGRLLVVGVISCLVYLKYSRQRLFLLALITLFSISVFLTSSSGSVILLLTVYISYFILNKINKVGIDKFILILLAFAFMFFVVVNFEELLLLIGKSPTLTNRTVLWGFVIVEIIKKPFFGYGYSGFWLGQEGPSSVIYQVSKEASGSTWEAPHAHNGYLDLMLDLGILGVIIFLIGYFNILKKVYSLFLNRRNEILEFILLFMTFNFITNLVESQILVENEFMWVLYAYVITLANKQMKLSKSSG